MRAPARTLPHGCGWWVAAGLVLVAAQAVRAAPAPNALTLTALNDFAAALDCRDRCEDSPANLALCLAQCHQTNPLLAAWDKDGNATVEYHDYFLATVEYMEGDDAAVSLCTPAGANLPTVYCAATTNPNVCWGDAGQTVVLPPMTCFDSSCSADPSLAPCPHDCAADPGHAKCADADADGLVAWVEAALGTSDAAAETSCAGNRDCNSFAAECVQYSSLADNLCDARACGAEGCTAFHLELVESNEQELLARVHYDYSPYPATVLDLKIEFDAGSLSLMDSRPLPVLLAADKRLETTQPSAGRIRLVVLDPLSLAPVPTGAIIELLFRRKTPNAGWVGFSTNDFDQQYAMAPEQVGPAGSVQTDLHDDALWGSKITLPAVVPGLGDRLLVYYDFGNATAPLAYRDTPSAGELCTVASYCDETLSLPLFDQLFAGVVYGGQSYANGVEGGAMYFDGGSDHVRLPWAPSKIPSTSAPSSGADQSFSISMWFLAEGASINELDSTPQVLFAHIDNNEAINFAFYAVPTTGGGVDLIYQEQAYVEDAPSQTVVASSLPLRTWTHFAFTLDAGDGTFTAYLDGVAVGAWTKSSHETDPAISCPQFTFDGRSVHLHQEGRGQYGGAPMGAAGVEPELVYLSSKENNLFGVERLDLASTARTVVLRAGVTNYRDADYNAGHDTLVYSSDASGHYEIWIANGDGSNPRQVTKGFGDSSRGIKARRPRWSPNGKRIVFQSGIFGADDNNEHRVTHLYLVPFDEVARQIAAPAGGGGTTPQLDYAQLVAQNRMNEFRLTSGATHHLSPRWLASDKVVFTDASKDYAARRVHEVALDNPAPADITPGAESYRLHDADIGSGLLLLERLGDWGATSVSAQFSAAAVDNLDGTHTITVTYTGSGLVKARNLRVLHGGGGTVHTSFTPDPGLPAGKAVIGISEQPASTRFEIASGDTNPIPTSTVIGTVVISGAVPGTGVQQYDSYPALLVANDVRQHTEVGPSLAPFVDFIEEAAFAQDLTAIVISGIKDSRPVLLRVPLTAAATVTSATIDSLNVAALARGGELFEGLRVRKATVLSACNWLGGYREKDTGRIKWGFRGAVDELRIHSYARGADSILAEAERGHEWLVANGLTGQLGSAMIYCSQSIDCPSYHLCDAGACVVTYCDPAEDPPTCPAGTLCSLLPFEVEQETSSAPGSYGRWACFAECSLDSECYQSDCANGPCARCEPSTGTCSECWVAEVAVGAVTYERLEGCPDPNAWACETGTCVSECYASENDEALYVCDPLTQSCRGGECVLEAWEWKHLAPATFSGLYKMNATYQSVPEVYDIVIQAFGAGADLQEAKLLVEGQTEEYGPFFQLGVITVTNRSEHEARRRPYSINTQERLVGMRLRLYEPPTDDIYEARCREGLATSCPAWAPAAIASRLGYPAAIPHYQILAACRATGRTDCPGDGSNFEELLKSTYPTILVAAVSYNGDGVTFDLPGQNKLCANPGSPSTNLVPNNSGSIATLNCSYEVGSDVAGLAFPVAPPGSGFPAVHGGMTETTSSCTVEIAQGASIRTEHCYSWLSDPSLDPLSTTALNGTFEYSDFRMFGY